MAVKLVEGLLSIGPQAFFACSALLEISIPATVTTIGEDAFDCCTALRNLELQNGLNEICHEAFNNCSSLLELFVPETVETIESMLKRLDRRGLSQWKLDLGRLVDSIRARGDMDSRNRCIDQITSKMASYEVLESTSLLEERLWLDIILRQSTNGGAGESLSSEDREACRIGSGASDVIPNVVQFMNVSE